VGVRTVASWIIHLILLAGLVLRRPGNLQVSRSLPWWLTWTLVVAAFAGAVAAALARRGATGSGRIAGKIRSLGRALRRRACLAIPSPLI
jgi:hypothetical protein